MKRILVIGAFALLSTYSFAQENLLPDGSTIFAESSKNWFVDMNGWANHGSNSVTNTFVDKFLFGGFINSDQKNAVFDRLSGNNTLGGQAGASISLTYRRDEKQWAWQIAYGYSQVQRIDFEEDLFKLVFDGNAGFDETLIQLDNSQSGSQGFHKWQVGIVDVETGSFARLGVYGGTNFDEVQLGSSSIQTNYSSANGNTFPGAINAVTDGFSEVRDSGGNGMFGAGFGIGVDAQVNRKFEFGTISLAVSDLGIMHWSNVERRRSDTKTSFNGFEFDLDGGGISLGSAEELVDSIFDVQTETINRTSLLPWQVTAIFISKAEKTLFTIAQLSLRPAAYSIPHLNVALNYKLGKAHFLWLSASGGGPEYFGFGAGAQFRLFEDSFISVSSRHAAGWVAQNGLARSLYVQFIQRL